MLSAAPPPPMAEAWRLEEDEEELREVGRRHRRVALSSAADRSERNKPDCRSSGQGPLSSIRAAIKRSSRTSSHSEQQRDRRRPEITIVAAEPLRPSSWFPGANPVTPHGLGFPSASSHAQWRRNEHIPAELPPSYEQVIKEINQVQVNTTNNNNAAAPRHTTTSATQTDFPEELIGHLPGSNVKTSVPTHWESAGYPDPFQFLTKIEPAKEQTAQPALARKPTVIRIPAKPGKSLNEIPHSPPPLPAEKPIGNTSNITVGKPNSGDVLKKVELGHSEQSGVPQLEPVLPPRPVDGKFIPARPPPPKGVPGRPPPPKLSAAKTSSQKDALSRSTSDIAPDKKPSKFRLGPKRAKSQVFKNPDPALPPRPKPGHPLYNKYMLPVPHGVAKEDCLPRNTGELSCKDSNHPPKFSDASAPHAVVLHDFPAEHADDLDLHSGDTVCLLEKIDSKWYRGKCGNRTGIFPASFVKVVIDVPEEGNRKKIPCSSQCIKGPRCVARFEYIGDQKDELSFSEGETIILKEYVNEEWAKGELRGTCGIFPLNFVEVIEDLPGTGTGAALKNKVEVSSSLPQNNRCSVEWCEALHDFTAETKDDLSFKKGDYIQILEQVDSEWYRGRLNEKEGIFPAVFVQTCSARVEPSQSVGGKKGKAKALYDFHGENEDELSFKAGDTITELESVDEDWMSGEIQGKSGIFPKNFVQILKTP
ncbi:SH3 domain-containing protein 19 isoform X4 [Haliaeetus albicilla]|uniref:SH3 domain-containing protein 19 isoform X4 n=1 Tax=Haliaeetus albicilla TaxID=8969 RepID=UPI0037E83D09